MKNVKDFNDQLFKYFHDLKIVADLANEAKEFMNIKHIFNVIRQYIGDPEIKSFMMPKETVIAYYLDRGDSDLTTIFYIKEDDGFLNLSVSDFLKINTVWLGDVEDFVAGSQDSYSADCFKDLDLIEKIDYLVDHANFMLDSKVSPHDLIEMASKALGTRTCASIKENYIVDENWAHTIAVYAKAVDDYDDTVLYSTELGIFRRISLGAFLTDWAVDNFPFEDEDELTPEDIEKEYDELQKSKLESIFTRMGLDLSDDFQLNLAHAHSLIKYVEMSKEDIDLINEHFN